MVEFLEETTEFIGIKLRRIREGRTLYWVPDPEEYGKPHRYLPADLPVFYNPLMEINRDLTIVSLAAYSDFFDKPLEELCYVEALAGSGIRGFRVLNEVGMIDVILNDINPLCIQLMHFNARFFSVNIRAHVQIFNYDANYLLNQFRLWRKSVDIVDIDPFGTPSPFIDSAIRALKKKTGLLLVTATDTAPLVGKFENASIRKYGTVIGETLFCNEIAVRALLYFIHREATKYRIGLKPIFGFFFRNFVKVGLISIPGRKTADKLWERIGWIKIKDDFEYEVLPLKKPEHNHKKLIGPLWIGEIFDKKFIKTCINKIPKIPISDQTKRELLKWLKAEYKASSLIMYYNLEAIASKLKRATPRIEHIIKKLRENGYIAERTHFDTKAIKTSAPYQKIVEAIKEL